MELQDAVDDYDDLWIRQGSACSASGGNEQHILCLTGISALQDCLQGTIFEAMGGPSANHLIQATSQF